MAALFLFQYMCLLMNVCLFDGPCFWCKKPLLLLLCEASAHNEKPMAKLLETYCVVCSNKGKFKGVNQVQKNQFIPISRLLQMKLSYLFGGLGMTEWLVRSSRPRKVVVRVPLHLVVLQLYFWLLLKKLLHCKG